MNADRGVLDNGGARPGMPHNVFLGHEFAVRAHQLLDDIESAAADWNDSTIGAQFARSKIDLPPAGLKTSVRIGPRERPVSRSFQFQFAD
jgi:hypothetical protein